MAETQSSDDDFQMQPVSSSNIKAVGYHLGTRVLRVEFLNGGVYTYHDVSPETHAGLMKADSKGSHLSAHIKGKHVHKKADSG